MPTDPAPPPQSEDSHSPQDADEPFSFSAPSTALSGLAIALLSVSVPVIAVVAERAVPTPGLSQTALDSHGPTPSATVTLTRAGESVGGDSRWKQE